MLAPQVICFVFAALHLNDGLEPASDLSGVSFTRGVMLDTAEETLPCRDLCTTGLSALQVILVERRGIGKDFFDVFELVWVVTTPMLALGFLVFVPAQANEHSIWWLVALTVDKHGVIELVLGHVDIRT